MKHVLAIGKENIARMTNKVQDIVSLDVTKITASNVVDNNKVQSIKPSSGNVLPTHYVPVVSVISGSNLDEKDVYQQGRKKIQK